MLKTSENPIAAYELAKWINHAQEPALLFATQQNFFPTAISVLEDPEFVAQEPEFYGGQKVNELFAEISDDGRHRMGVAAVHGVRLLELQ